ncbi:MAG: alanine dehydrogenase [Candidatus Micrarchaeota archaeon]
MAETLILEEKLVKEILQMKDVLPAVEGAFREKGLGNVEMPPKMYIMYPAGDLRVMPAYLKNLKQSGLKAVTVFPNNPREKNIPTVLATVILIDTESGAPLAVMGGSWLTAMRTGAAGGIATKYLAKKNAKNVAFIGTGVQAHTQLLAHREVMKIRKVYALDHSRKHTEEFVKFAQALGLEAEEAEMADAKRACADSDILVTTTPVHQPIVKNEWVHEGMHINAIGADAPGKEELEPEILKRSMIVIDDWEQASHSGEINVPISKKLIGRKDIHAELGEIVAGKKKGREGDSEITVFDSTGLGIQDIVTATIVMNRAKAQNKGLRINLATL